MLTLLISSIVVSGNEGAIDSNDTADITSGIYNQEPIKSPTNDENKKVGQTIIHENVVEILMISITRNDLQRIKRNI